MFREVQRGKGYPDRGKCMCKGNEVEKCQELGFLKTWVHTRKWAGEVTQCLINNAGNQTAGSIAHKDIQGGGLSLEMKSKTELLILPSPSLPQSSQWQLLFPSFSSQNHWSHLLHPTLNDQEILLAYPSNYVQNLTSSHYHHCHLTHPSHHCFFAWIRHISVVI